jgi:hypothetical protein
MKAISTDALSWKMLDTDALYPIYSKLWGITFKNKVIGQI